MDQKPKIAVLLCGHIRTWEQCRSSFVKFMEDVDYDVFIHTYTTVKGYHPYIRDSCKISDNNHRCSGGEIVNKIKIPFKRLVIEADDLLVDEIKKVEEKDLQCFQWSQYDPYDDLQVLKGKGISIRTYLQYRKLKLCNDMCKEYERLNNVNYDFIIKVRMDIHYSHLSEPLTSLLKKVEDCKILTSGGNCQPNDHIYICSSEDMDKLIQGLGSVNFHLDREYNPHEYLTEALNTSGLSYNPCINGLNLVRI